MKPTKLADAPGDVSAERAIDKANASRHVKSARASGRVKDAKLCRIIRVAVVAP